jgi:hypothetical protein
MVQALLVVQDINYEWLITVQGIILEKFDLIFHLSIDTQMIFYHGESPLVRDIFWFASSIPQQIYAKTFSALFLHVFIWYPKTFLRNMPENSKSHVKICLHACWVFT